METHDSTPLISEQSNSKIHKHACSHSVEILFVPMLDFTTIWHFKYDIQVLYPASFKTARPVVKTISHATFWICAR